MEAASGGYAEVGRVLLDKGADVNAPPVPSSRDTALTIAADKGHYKFCELLIGRYVMNISFVNVSVNHFLGTVTVYKIKCNSVTYVFHSYTALVYKLIVTIQYQTG